MKDTLSETEDFLDLNHVSTCDDPIAEIVIRT